jgi:hypothetical protein
VNSIHAIQKGVVINTTSTVYEVKMVCVNASLITYWILKLKFVIKLLRNIAIVLMIAVKINSVLMICANVNEDMNTFLLLIHVTRSFVISTAIVTYLIRIAFALDIAIGTDIFSDFTQ